MLARYRVHWLALVLAVGVGLSAFARATHGQLLADSPPPALSPEIQLDEAGNAALSHLERSREFVAAGQWDEAVEALRGLMENDGEQVIVVPDNAGLDAARFTRHVTLRYYCQMRLAELQRSAPEAVQLYRRRVDPLAERWFKQAVSKRDEELLERIVDQLFVSSYGDDALYQLGQFALQRGDHARARESWERISPMFRAPQTRDSTLRAWAGRPLWLALRGIDLNERWSELRPLLTEARLDPTWLAYPDTDLDLAEVRARLVLVSILEESPARARLELDVLRRLDPDVEGQLAGRRGKYADLLEEMLARSADWPKYPAEASWTTFAGSFDRDGSTAAPVDIALRPLWQADLPVVAARGEYIGLGRSRVAEEHDGLLCYHPVVVKGVVLVAAGSRPEDVLAFDLSSGAALWSNPSSRAAGDEQDADAGVGVPLTYQQRERYVGVPRYTLTVHEDLLLARLGSPVTAVRRNYQPLDRERGYVAGMDWKAQGLLQFLLKLDSEQWTGNWAFEGTPMTDGVNLYTAVRRRDDVRSQAYVACFDLQRQRLRWRKFVVAAETPGHGQWDELTHNLLTRHEDTIYYNTNLGAVAALRAEDGGIKWIAGYPRGSFRDGEAGPAKCHFFRDLNPCLVHKDLVIVAPQDCGRIMALDAASGQLVWTTPDDLVADAVHLLGVGSDRLIAAGQRLYWIDVHSGRVAGRFPAPGASAVRGYGRGQLAGGRVYWPTREAIYVFAREGPQQVRQPIRLASLGVTGGNLLMVNGVLLIASADKLIAFFSRESDDAAAR